MRALSTNHASVQKFECAEAQFTGWSGGTRIRNGKTNAPLQGPAPLKMKSRLGVPDHDCVCDVTHRTQLELPDDLGQFSWDAAGAEGSSCWR